MRLGVLIMTDGRDDALARCVASLPNALYMVNVWQWWLHDDSGSGWHREQLAMQYPHMLHIGEGPRRGFGGAIRHAWQFVTVPKIDYVLHVEDDFLFTRPVDVMSMTEVLAAHDHLAQMALRRQSWNSAEKTAGGIVEQHPEAYEEKTWRDGDVWLEHRLCFTTNPCVYRTSLCGVGWPDVPHSEGIQTHRFLTEGTPEAHGQNVRFGYWGARDSGEWVEHIGHERVGTGY